MGVLHYKKPLQDLTTLKVGGPAEVFWEVETERELDEAVGYAQSHSLPVTVLGGGSNVLIADAGVPGLVIKMAITDVSIDVRAQHALVTAAAGVVFDDLVAQTVSAGYWGLENLSHIPGTVGATPVQNVGAYGVEVKDIIETVRVYNILERKFEVLTNTECQFEYRNSLFKTEAGSRYIVTAVTYRLSLSAQPVLQYADLQERFASSEDVSVGAVRDAVIAIRAQKFPDWHQVGTAGSFFKNPVVARGKFEELSARYPGLPGYRVTPEQVKIPLAWILDKVLQIKGTGTEAIGQYERQALVLVHRGGARADDIVSYANSIVEKVAQTMGIHIEWEVTRIGFLE